MHRTVGSTDWHCEKKLMWGLFDPALRLDLSLASFNSEDPKKWDNAWSMAMARPGGIHGVMEVKKEDHWAGEDSLNHSAGRCFLLYLSIPLPFFFWSIQWFGLGRVNTPKGDWPYLSILLDRSGWSSVSHAGAGRPTFNSNAQINGK